MRYIKEWSVRYIDEWDIYICLYTYLEQQHKREYRDEIMGIIKGGLKE